MSQWSSLCKQTKTISSIASSINVYEMSAFIRQSRCWIWRCLEKESYRLMKWIVLRSCHEGRKSRKKLSTSLEVQSYELKTSQLVFTRFFLQYFLSLVLFKHPLILYRLINVRVWLRREFIPHDARSCSILCCSIIISSLSLLLQFLFIILLQCHLLFSPVKGCWEWWSFWIWFSMKWENVQ